jgi:hypothetical protein
LVRNCTMRPQRNLCTEEHELLSLIADAK